MRELLSQESQAIAGGEDALVELRSFIQQGLTHGEKVLAVTSASVGILVGTILPRFLGPTCAVGALLGWYIYDTWYCTNAHVKP